VLWLPKKLSSQTQAIGFLWGLATGILFDFTIGGGLIDFYQVNDSNRYEGMDVLYYTLFAPFGYFFFYFFETLNVRKTGILLYVLAWALVGVAAQWLFTALDIVKLQRGYTLAYSFPVFLFTQTVTAMYYMNLRKRNRAAA